MTQRLYHPAPKTARKCAICSSRFKSQWPDARFCSDPCRQKGKRLRHKPIHTKRWKIKQEVAQGIVRYFRRCPMCLSRFKTKDPRKRRCSAYCRDAPYSTPLAWASCLVCRRIRCKGGTCIKQHAPSERPKAYHCKDCGARLTFDFSEARFGPGPSRCEECTTANSRRLRKQARRRRRSRIKGNLNGDYDLQDIIRRDGAECWICGQQTTPTADYSPRKTTIDHIVPVSKFGPDIKSNVRIACHQCNALRGAAEVQFEPLTLL